MERLLSGGRLLVNKNVAWMGRRKCYLSDTKDHPREELLTSEQIAAILKISLVTLHTRMKQGLPFHKDVGKPYFLRSEVMQYIKQKKKKLPLFYRSNDQMEE